MATSIPSSVITKILLARMTYSNIYTLEEDTSAFLYQAGMMIDADGAYRAYNPDRISGLDYLGNAGTPGNWWALVTDNGKAGGSPLIQKSTDPAPGFYISTTSLQDSSKKANDPTRYVDSESIPFIVLPGNGKFGAALSDFCMVYNPVTKKSAGGIFADVGPRNQIGEASIAMADMVGVQSNAKYGGQAHGLVYVVFPKSSVGWPLSNEAIQQNANDAFAKWGGLNKLQMILPDVIKSI